MADDPFADRIQHGSNPGDGRLATLGTGCGLSGPRSCIPSVQREQDPAARPGAPKKAQAVSVGEKEAPDGRSVDNDPAGSSGLASTAEDGVASASVHDAITVTVFCILVVRIPIATCTYL